MSVPAEILEALQEILADDGEDDEEEDEEEQEEQAGSPPVEPTPESAASGKESKVLNDVRKWGKQMEKRAKRLQKEVQELAEFKATVESERRLEAVKAAFRKLELDERLAGLYLKSNEGSDVTDESIAQFVEEYGLAAPGETGTSSEEVKTKQPKPNFEPSGPGLVTKVKGEKKLVSRDEWEALYFSKEPEAKEQAARLLREGKVDMSGTSIG